MGALGRVSPVLAGRVRRIVRRWLPAARRWGPTLLLSVAAVVVFLVGAARVWGVPSLSWKLTALTLAVAGSTARLWQAPESENEALRLRGRHRRIIWRVALVVGYGALARQMADTAVVPLSNSAASWLLGAAAALMLAEPLVWRLWPASIRVAVRRARSAELIDERLRSAGSGPGVFYPELGACGRPEPLLRLEADQTRRSYTPTRLTPARWSVEYPRGGMLSDPVYEWFDNAAIEWDGKALVVTDGAGVPHRLPVVGAGGPGGVAEIVWIQERGERWEDDERDPLALNGACQVRFLDARGYCVARMPAAGFGAKAVCRVARAAGLAFAAYFLGYAEFWERRLTNLLFPGGLRAVKIRPGLGRPVPGMHGWYPEGQREPDSVRTAVSKKASRGVYAKQTVVPLPHRPWQSRKRRNVPPRRSR